MKLQHALKKYVIKPSDDGALFFCITKTTCYISWKEISLINASFFFGLTILGMNIVILLMAFCQFRIILGSVIKRNYILCHHVEAYVVHHFQNGRKYCCGSCVLSLIYGIILCSSPPSWSIELLTSISTKSLLVFSFVPSYRYFFLPPLLSLPSFF